MFEVVSSVNIATGAHAGNQSVMDAAVRQATRLGVSVGAHPSYPDREGFGRRVIDIGPDALRVSLLAQIGALEAIARSYGQALHHIKPHGALYHSVATDFESARVMAEVARTYPGVPLVLQAGSPGIGEMNDVPTLAEAFADRGYRADGRLVARDEPGGLLTDPDEAAEQAVEIATRHRALAQGGAWVDVTADTLCMHGDTPGASAIGKAVRSALERQGVQIRSPY